MPESDRVILLNQDADDEEEDDDLNLVDPSGMFSLTEMAEPVNADPDLEESKNEYTPSVIYVAAVVAALGGLLFGYDIGVISGAKIQIQREIGLTCLQIQVIVAMLPVGAMTASLLGGMY